MKKKLIIRIIIYILLVIFIKVFLYLPHDHCSMDGLSFCHSIKYSDVLLLIIPIIELFYRKKHIIGIICVIIMLLSCGIIYYDDENTVAPSMCSGAFSCKCKDKSKLCDCKYFKKDENGKETIKDIKCMINREKVKE